MAKDRWGKAAAAIRKASSIVLACHVNPDGDAIGSLCAMGLGCEALGKRVAMLSPDGVPEHCALIPGADRVLSTTAERDFDLGIGLDADGSDRRGPAEPILLSAPVVIDIDHHVGAERYGQIQLVEPSAAATGELVYELLRILLEDRVSPAIAEGLMAAIVTDTGGFRYPSVTDRTLEVAADLIRLGAHPSPIVERVYGRRSYSATRLLGEALAGVQRAVGGRFAWATLDREAFQRAGAREEETDGIVTEVRAIEGVGVAALLREEPEGTVRVSLRSRDGTDVAALAERFGGGGHRAAAGCTLPGPLSAAVAAVRGAVEEVMAADAGGPQPE
jgi:phosphoesterase RecJ-like protein